MPGPLGITGVPGLPGQDGPTGQNGERGVQGQIGAPGYTGPYGTPGLPGTKGSQGSRGLSGIDGVPGIPGLPGPRGSAGLASSGGENYVRWGRTVCPDNDGTDLVYSGWAAGGNYNDAGSGADYLCITKTPQYLSYSSAPNSLGALYGAEYEADSGQPYHGVHNQNVPCAVCHVVQRSVLMIPGQYTCPTGWTTDIW